MDIRLSIWIKGVLFPVSPAKPPEGPGPSTDGTELVSFSYDQLLFESPSEPAQNFIP